MKDFFQRKDAKSAKVFVLSVLWERPRFISLIPGVLGKLVTLLGYLPPIGKNAILLCVLCAFALIKICLGQE